MKSTPRSFASGMAPVDQESCPSQRPKRRKVAESCKVCRAKKTRCDGLRPVCSSCEAKGIGCEYNKGTVLVSNGNLLDIEARLRKLEQQASATLVPPQIPEHGFVTHSCFNQSEQQPQLQTNLSSYPDTGNTGVEDELPFTEHSTTQFIRDISQIAGGQSNTHLQASLCARIDALPPETNISFMVVSARAVSDDLLDYFENFIYPTMSILHMPTFRERYNRLWEPQKQSANNSLAAETTFYATLNIVFALSSLSSTKLENRLKVQNANTFYCRARVLLPLDALDTPSLGVVQYLLLTSIYLNATKYSNRLFNTLAVAIRVAQTLGLHEDKKPSPGNQLGREINRRVWYHCLTLERLYSGLYGRNVILKCSYTVPLPEKIDDMYLLEDGEGVQPAGIPSVIDAFIATIRIFEVLEGARVMDISNDDGLRLAELIQLLQLNEDLNQIENSLPWHLKSGNDTKPHIVGAQVFKLQTEVVSIRILTTRLIILRPSILVAARHSVQSMVHKPTFSRTEVALRNESSTICVQAALSAIETLHANMCTNMHILSASVVYVTLMAATVIIAASLVPELEVNPESGSPYSDTIAKSLEILGVQRWQVEGVSKATDLLKKFLETVNHARRQRNSGPFIVSPTNLESSQNEDGELRSEFEEMVTEFDFSDPLWNLQWNNSIPLFDVSNNIF